MGASVPPPLTLVPAKPDLLASLAILVRVSSPSLSVVSVSSVVNFVLAGYDVEDPAGNEDYFGDGFALKVCLDAGEGLGRILGIFPGGAFG